MAKQLPKFTAEELSAIKSMIDVATIKASSAPMVAEIYNKMQTYYEILDSE